MTSTTATPPSTDAKEPTMAQQTFSVDDLMDLLVQRVGLSEQHRTDRGDARFSDLGLDSLAFLELQNHLGQAYGVEMPDDRADAYTLDDIVQTIRSTTEQAVAS